MVNGLGLPFEVGQLPPRGQLQIRKATSLDYRVNPAICRATSGAKPRTSSSPCALTLADAPGSGYGLPGSSLVVGVVDKVFRDTCRSVGLLAGRVHLARTSRTLTSGDIWVPMYLKPPIDV
jgi:hypothetical protein